MNIEAAAPFSNNIGTLEMKLELKDLDVTLAGLEQIKVAAQEAAAAVTSIGASALPAREGIDTLALILAELREHTKLLTNLCRHQDDAAKLASLTVASGVPFVPRRTAVPMPIVPVVTDGIDDYGMPIIRPGTAA